MTRSEILSEIQALVSARLFGPGPWCTDNREAIDQLSARVRSMGLEEQVPGETGFQPTALGKELGMELLHVFIGLWEAEEVPWLLQEYGFIDDIECQHIEDLLGAGGDPETVLKPYVRDAYHRYFRRDHTGVPTTTPKLFTVTENFEGRRCHWYVSHRKHALAGVADTMREFFTEREARTFVKIACERLDNPDLCIAPAPAMPPSKSFEDRMLERGEELHVVRISKNFSVCCFDDITPEQFPRACQRLIDAGYLVKKCFVAEVLFLNPDHVPAAVEALTAAGLEWEYNPDAIDNCGPTVFGTVTGETTHEKYDIGYWLSAIVDPFSGGVVMWRYNEPQKPTGGGHH